jgi:uncharacterized OB-fold protein
VSEKAYPQPREDTDNAAFLAAWREGVLKIQACGVCGKAVFYPRPICPHCWSDRLENRTASGRGRVVSYSLIHRPNDPAFNDEVPIILAEVELEEGALMLARVIGCEAARVKSGMRVELPTQEVGRRYPLPVFQPAVEG